MAAPTADAATVAQELQDLLRAGSLRPWNWRGRELLPVVQGGMGVGISAGGLAGTVAGLGGVGTVSSVDLRRLHPDLMAETGHLDKEPDARARIEAVNREALRREIARARTLSQGRGLIAVNIMKALSAYEQHVRTALEAGADALVVGAGLPMDLPELARDFPDTALVPILSDARGIQLVIKRWEKRGRLPDAIVIEHPRLAGGHLGAARITDLNDTRFDFDVVIPAVRAFFDSAGLSREIPLIAAGGICTHADVLRLQALGASAVQLGTAFAVSEESNAHPAFKQVLAGAKPEDIVEFLSVAGLPARAVRTHWMEKYLRVEPKLQAVAHVKRCKQAFDCLAHCGLRDGDPSMGQFCIDQQLSHALAGHTDKGLFFRGAGTLPFGDQIRPVRDLLRWLVAGEHPTTA